MSESEGQAGAELQVLIARRSYLRQRVTKLHQKCIAEGEMTNIELYSDIAKVKDLQAQLRELDNNVITLKIKQGASEEELQSQADSQENYEDKLQESQVRLQGRVGAVTSQPAGEQTSTLIPQQRLTLPEISLPTYSHAPNESLEKFFYNFDSIIGKHKLSEYEQFLYLRGTLSKAPRALIDSLDVNEQNYARAKALLMDAFGSIITQQYEVLRKLAVLKLHPNADPYSFIGEMRTIVTNVKNLKINVDTILQFFIWHALNDKFQDQVIMITNKNKPNLEEINTNIFAATERYLKLKDKPAVHKPLNANTTNYAVGVKVEVICPLCKYEKKEFKHELKDCKLFNTARKK